MTHHPHHPQTYVSVDVETAGPHPAAYALLSIGACLVHAPERGFYAELQPDFQGAAPGALEVTGLSLERLAREGETPTAALARFEAWLRREVPGEPVFVAFNAPFDWMFVNVYFHRYRRGNPFGYLALDVRAYAMGALALPWEACSQRALREHLGIPKPLTHHALADARDQAELFAALMEARHVQHA